MEQGEPLPLLYVPTGHAVHAVAPVPEYVPVGHPVHGLGMGPQLRAIAASADEVEKVPAAQRVHVLCWAIE